MASPQLDAVDPITQPDKLSYLPTELLDSIFNQAWTEKRPSGPINRALLPWYDRYFWKTVKVWSQADYAKFLDIVTRRPHVRAFCETLRVNLGPEALTPTWLETVLPGLPILVTLELNDLSSAAFDRLLSEQQPYLLTTCLRKLTIYCTTGTRKDPYHPSHWKPVLDRLPELVELGLDLRSIEMPTGRIKTKSTYAFPQLESLYVALPQKGRSSVLTLIESSPNLKALELASNSPIPDFEGALAALKEPGKLTRLELDADPKKGWALPTALDKLTSLHDITLDGKWQHLTEEDLDRLCDLPLRRFALGAESDFPLQLLASRLELGRLPQLQTCQFDNIVAEKGYRWRSQVWDWDDRLARIKQHQQTWRRKHCTKTFTWEALTQVQSFCSKNNIQLVGTITSLFNVNRRMEAALDEIRTLIRQRGTGLNRGINGGPTDSDYEYYDDEDYGYYGWGRGYDYDRW